MVIYFAFFHQGKLNIYKYQKCAQWQLNIQMDYRVVKGFDGNSSAIVNMSVSLQIFEYLKTILAPK